jgi:small subunit ribosomal protein S17
MRERRRTFTGRVVSNKMQKTVVVQVERTRRHPLYSKVIRVRNRFKAHTETPCNEGDLVKIIESRPFSKEKHWLVTQVMQKGEVLALPEVVIPPSKEEKPNEATMVAEVVEAAAPTTNTEGAPT